MWKLLIRDNIVLSGLLGLCPLLAVSTNLITALTLSLLTLLVLLCSVALVSLLRMLTHEALRLPLFMLYISALTVVLQLLLERFAYPTALQVGLFLPLIITNCLVLSEVELLYRSDHSLLKGLQNALRTALSFGATLLAIGALRELLGGGTLLSGGASFSLPTLHLGDFHGFPLAVLPAGAFFTLAFLMVLRNYWLSRHPSHS